MQILSLSFIHSNLEYLEFIQIRGLWVEYNQIALHSKKNWIQFGFNSIQFETEITTGNIRNSFNRNQLEYIFILKKYILS